MKKLLLTFTLLLTGLSSISFNHQVVKAEENIDKVIYFDFSLLNGDLDGNLVCSYYDESEHSFNLISDGYDIYHSDINIPYEVLSNEDYHLDLTIFEENISFINSPLKDSIYNYVCFNKVDDQLVIEGYGYYSPKLTNPGASYKTQRIWLNNDVSSFYSNDSWGKGNKTAAAYVDNGQLEIIIMTAMLNSYDSEYYYYADIPSNISSLYFIKLSQSENHNYLFYDVVKVSQLSYGSCYFMNENDDGYYVTTGIVYNADAMLLSSVVEAFLTYGKDDSNGCSSLTIRNLFNTWFMNKSASSSDLKNAKILDYTGYSANGNSYEGLTKTSSFSVNEKWNTMCSQAGIDPKTGAYRSFNTSFLKSEEFKATLVIGGVAIVIIALVIIYLIIKRKKMNN